MSSLPNPDVARDTLIQIVTAARSGNVNLAGRLASEYQSTYGDILPLLISAVTMIETILLSIAEMNDMDADKLWQGIALGISVKNQRTKE